MNVTLVLISILFILAPDVGQNDSDELIKVKLQGTALDILPDWIELASNDPDALAKALVKRGGIPVKLNGPRANNEEPRGERNDYVSVLRHSTEHRIAKPAKWNRETLGYEFQNGDVTYIFVIENKKEEDSFVHKYKLSKHASFKTPLGITKPLYIASAGHLVKLYFTKGYYWCPMDPKPVLDKPGQCPVCGQELVELPEYRIIPPRHGTE